MEFSFPEDLHVLAQLAITLAGFTGIIGALQTRGGNVLSSQEALHIAGLLLGVTLVIFLAFVPGWVALVPHIGDNIWPWSMRILLTFHLVAWAIAFPFVRAGGLWFKKWPITDRIGAAVIVVLGVACVIAEVFVVTGTYVEFSPLLFESVLIFFLGMSMFNFIRLLLLPIL